MKRGMTIEYLMCRADLNFEVDFGVNGAIGTIATKWDLIVSGSLYNSSFSSIINLFLNTLHSPLIMKSMFLKSKKHLAIII